MTAWVIRSARYPERQALALREGMVAIGWPETDDLDGFASVQALTQNQHVGEPDRPIGRASNHAGQLRAFSRQVERGDLVILTRDGGLLAFDCQRPRPPPAPRAFTGR
jgi:restriction system protein